MEWRNVVIARPGSLVTTASGAGGVFFTAFSVKRWRERNRTGGDEDEKDAVGFRIGV